ncbi:MAG: hypothetical protein JW904_06350 [Spirochaetales bacterium]|nr:hypothetical protein [Spirochaetales bacterium]
MEKPAFIKKYNTPLVVALAAAVAVLYVLFHLHYMQQFLDWDQIVYSNNIITSIKYNTIPVVNPHHVHMEIGGKLFHELTGIPLGIQDVVFSNRLRSLLFAAIGLFFLLLFIHELTGKTLMALAGTLLAALSMGYLHYATKVDTPIFPAVMMIVLLWILQRLRNTPRLTYKLLFAAAGGLACAAGIAAHQYMAIPAGICCLFFIFPKTGILSRLSAKPFAITLPEPKLDFKKQLIHIVPGAVLAVSAVIFSLLLYFTIASFFRMTYTPREGIAFIDDIQSFQRWFLGYARLDAWGYGFKRFNPKAPFTGFTDSFLTGAHGIFVKDFNFVFSYKISAFFNKASFPYNVLAVFTLIVGAGSILLAGPLIKKYGRLFPCVFFSFAALAVFSTYWEPHYFEFWLVPNVLFVILSVMFLNCIGEQTAKLFGKAGGLLRPVPALAILLAASVLFLHNTEHYLVPYSRVKHLQAISSSWDPSYYNLWSDSVYKYPENVYKDVYGTKQGEVWPVRKD